MTDHIEPTELDPLEAARMRAMGFDTPTPDAVPVQDRVLIQSVLEDRMGEYFRDNRYGYRLNTRDLSGVVADIVFAALRRDRERRDA